ncbi:MAG: hypothetical protein NTV15_01485, partial [Candidatus Bathyarchaeota archaeon]|nr:hypothetical protein [Candidatus Bathyarchaeota archaeon]
MEKRIDVVILEIGMNHFRLEYRQIHASRYRMKESETVSIHTNHSALFRKHMKRLEQKIWKNL